MLMHAPAVGNVKLSRACWHFYYNNGQEFAVAAVILLIHSYFQINRTAMTSKNLLLFYIAQFENMI